MDDFFDRYRPKRIIDLNIVPILDMLISIIFFLLLSTSFIGYTKLQVPPASVSTVTSPVAPEPLSPKLMVAGKDQKVRLILVWKGEKPGRKIESVDVPADDSRAKIIQEKVFGILKEFNTKYPGEKTLQMGLSPKLPYQFLIASMDAARETVPDVVLIDYNEVQALAAQY